MTKATKPGQGPEPAKIILVVDDEPDITAYLAGLLEERGFRALTANTAADALETLETIDPDLMSFDIMMPKRSGIALFHDVKRNPRLRQVPTIIISAFSLARDYDPNGFRKIVPEGDAPPPDAFLEKPVDPGKFIATVERLLAAPRNPRGPKPR